MSFDESLIAGSTGLAVFELLEDRISRDGVELFFFLSKLYINFNLFFPPIRARLDLHPPVHVLRTLKRVLFLLLPIICLRNAVNCPLYHMGNKDPNAV